MTIETFPTRLWNYINSSSRVANAAYTAWRKVYSTKERLQSIVSRQKPNVVTGLYDMIGLNIATTEICNSACRFCVYPLIDTPKKAMSNSMFTDIVSAWSKFGGTHKRAINLTPGTPPGECLTDNSFPEKLKIVKSFDYKTFFVTNGISLHKYEDVILNTSKYGIEGLSISIGSLDRAIYFKIFGVDRCETVKTNIFSLLANSARLNWPIDITICFRNAEKPGDIIKHPDFARLRSYLNPRCKVMFTTWWDDWGGQVPNEKMQMGEIQVRKPLNLARLCQGSLLFSLRPSDRNIRFCGCRYLKDVDDQIVGDIDEGFAAAHRRMLEHHENFKKGIRVKTCQDCGAYKQA